MFFIICAFIVLTNPETGRDVAGLAQKTQRGFVDESVMTTMYLINARQDTVVRNLKNLTIERANSEDYSIIQFLNPPDVRGTSLLTYQNPRGDDQQWLYLPELRRVKKISSRNKSGAFMGSEFAYEDISNNTLDRFEYHLLGEEMYENRLCYIVERKPLYENSGYLKIKTWYDKKNCLIRRAEYTDRKNSLLKALTLSDWQQYETGTWRANSMRMENLQTHKISLLRFTNRLMKIGLQENSFNKRNLQRLLN